MSTATSSASLTLHDRVDDAFVAQYARDGFAILRGALSLAEVDAVNAEALRICRAGLNPVDSGIDAHEGESDADVLRQYLCIHHPHKISTAASQVMLHPTIVDALTKVIGADVKSMQTMLFIKSEGKPGQAWHQDEHFIPTRDRSLAGVWIALDDATIENGCLWVLPGSHRPGVLYPDRELDDDRFDCTDEAYGFPYRDEDAVPVEVPAGAALFFNGYLLHRSLENSGRHGYRRAFVTHYMSASSLLPWGGAEGRHAAELDFRDIVMVAGTDPYAYKGTKGISEAGSRADRSGGCDR